MKCIDRISWACPPSSKPMGRALCLSLFLGLSMASCSWKKTEQEPAVVIPPRWVGTIRMVNSPENFALIETTMPVPAGTTIHGMRNREKTSTLRTTSLKNHPFLIADIVDGTPLTEDRICLPPPASAGNSSIAP